MVTSFAVKDQDRDHIEQLIADLIPVVGSCQVIAHIAECPHACFRTSSLSFARLVVLSCQLLSSFLSGAWTNWFAMSSMYVPETLIMLFG